ncbi:MAG TPA: nicotinate-nucleotide--dimethylbenzimidazole phosphoribosyltransferase [Mycobacteriales bacterium]|nr:nicotinate-nucleotide--dimethylbenzimidazole phosphoribosyltransferase [Mycobacteriales bacterium]
MKSFVEAREAVVATDADAARNAREQHLQLTKPPGSLGALEDLGVQLAAIAGAVPPPVPEPVTIAVFAADHGVVAEGVTAWPQEVTAQMLANFAAGGAAINVLGRQVGADVVVVDVGVATDLESASPLILDRRIRKGTNNLAAAAAMTPEETTAALDVGAAVAAEAIGRGARMLVTGDMGIGNTTAATAVVAAMVNADPGDITGPGAGAAELTVVHKIDVIRRALRRLNTPADPLTVLSEVGGLEIAALVGYITAGAAHRVPVLLDGLIADAAALLATQLTPDVRGYLIAGHRSTEPAAKRALEHLRLEPLIDLRLRLGEGSGAAIAVPIVQAAARILGEMATFDSAGVSSKVES